MHPANQSSSAFSFLAEVLAAIALVGGGAVVVALDTLV